MSIMLQLTGHKRPAAVAATAATARKRHHKQQEVHGEHGLTRLDKHIQHSYRPTGYTSNSNKGCQQTILAFEKKTIAAHPRTTQIPAPSPCCTGVSHDDLQASE
jgi:hypothetical protein